jgi:hypothetical protein
MFALRIWQIVGSLKAREIEVIGCQTGFVVVLGIGPRLLAPLRETFGRNPLYLICFTLFTLLHLLYSIYFTPNSHSSRKDFACPHYPANVRWVLR